MARVERPVFTVTAPNGEQVPVLVFALPVEEDECVSAAEFLPFEKEEKKIPAVVASGPTDAEIDAMSIDDMLAIIERDTEEIVQKMKKEREDAGRG
ncbi:hypothetical protein FPSE_06365 [Fusarium pseudograminearum CS3096]|uniref:Uncharacterized protein n=1 Tax=Fusarium pseudograminearum (strain CS3096) TaxID=1028729 RepID=K3VGK3_FUSPC|nr:hypothetical protein FPSE_06365 [Fusarium pseudograminearum CS3096]EKJ73447.1 hypothetical protein FPSE_06365 [Fusarium pseudograminearum CS3096]